MSAAAYPLVDFGLVCALGRDRGEIAANLRRGVAPGMRELGGLYGGDRTFYGFLPGWGAARPADFAADETRIGRLVELAAAQIAPSVRAAVQRFGARRVGVVIGSSGSTMEEFIDHPDHIDMAYASERLAAAFGIAGPQLTVSTACSSSAKTFAAARRLLEGGAADAVIVGGADAYTRTVVEGFHALEALSPGRCRPCSPRRDGINLGEGAALFLMLAPEAKAAADGGVALLGVGESSDAYHLTAPDPSGAGAEASMRAALADAGVDAAAISFVNLHGTGTVYNDAMELAAVRRVFGRAVCASSTKPLTGHCLGAAGAVEAALCAIALEGGGDGGGCARPRRLALSNSFAFGGSNASVVLGEGVAVTHS